jgi:hypothetical protein
MPVTVKSRLAIAVAVRSRRPPTSMLQLPARPASPASASRGPGVYPPYSW